MSQPTPIPHTTSPATIATKLPPASTNENDPALTAMTAKR